MTGPPVLELHVHQADLPPATAGLRGSPISDVAPMFDPVVWVATVDVGKRFAKASLNDDEPVPKMLVVVKPLCPFVSLATAQERRSVDCSILYWRLSKLLQVKEAALPSRLRAKPVVRK